jgi:hypothetical protein
MNDPDSKDVVAEYLALREANDRLRERGNQWLWNSFDAICSEINSDLSAQNRPRIQVGRHEWQFNVESSTMVGERFGARYREKTLVVEVGWPREPRHGFVPGGGLACAVIGFSQNVMIDARTVAEMILKRQGDRDPAWYLINNKTPGGVVSVSTLQTYIKMLLQ